MKLLKDTNGIIAAMLPINGGIDRKTRRAREQEAVNTLIHKLLDSKATIGHLPGGAPYIVNKPHLHISISHSLDQAAVAISDSVPVGIDTETLRLVQLQRVSDRYLSATEKEKCTAPQDMLTSWCIKEAAYKAAMLEGIDFVRDISICRENRTVTVCGRHFNYEILETDAIHCTVLVIGSGQPADRVS